MREIITVTKALSDENRLRILMMIGDHKPCVCQIVEVLGLATSTVSKHLSILRQAGFLETKKDGRWTYYFIPEEKKEMISPIFSWVMQNLKDHENVIQDQIHLQKVVQIDPAVLCRTK